MDEPAIALRIEQLTKTYSSKAGSAEALKNVSFDVPLGQTCCLLGPNGSGKTTLLKIIAGLLSPSSGSISIMGIDPQKDPVSARASVGWMPAEERSGFYGRLSGRDNLKFFGALHGVPLDEQDRVIGNLSLLLDMNDDTDKSMLQISAGAKQKIGIARALLHSPPILVLDEPLRNLDPHTIVRFRRLLKDHLTRLQKKTVLLSTHQLEEARRVADMIVILHRGQVIRSLSSRDLESEIISSSLEDFYLKTIDAEDKQ